MKRNFLLIMFFFTAASVLLAQIDPQILKYRSEPYGDKTYRKKGIMDGNRIRTIYRNDGQVGTWPDRPSGEWPKGTGHNYIDGVTDLISAAVRAPGNGELVHPLMTSYREEVNFDPVTNELWVMEPVPGYANPSSEEPAISTKPSTWPLSWPSVLPYVDNTWNGYWYGYFGKGVQNADFETFYVMDDSKAKKYSKDPYDYFPIASDHNRTGLGLRVEVRGFQWSHVLAENCIFWHYDIINISDVSYDTTYFGMYCDTGVGGVDDGGDDNASYNTLLDIAYAFDNDGVAPPGNWKTGYVGYAYLESPGNAFNGIDDDEDGMIDETRDNNIDDNHNWVGFTDLNNNGKWDPELNEPLNDDVGHDGIGPLDLGYIGPDEGEGDGKPTDGEPNFDRLDKDESDQIGLTSLSIYRLAGKGPTDGWPKNDEVMWRKMAYQNFDTTLQNSNISLVFGSGPFPLKKNKRERFSMSLVYGVDFNDMIFNKQTVQDIYNANYNFTKPPYKPTLTAVAGDKRVFLYWDSYSETFRDRFLGFENGDPKQGYKKAFEGYLLYRSEEPEFNDIKVITDSKGEAKYWKPIAQWDIVDGIKGPDPIGINGAHFWRGDDTGLEHSYVDTTVVNGKAYYYALVAYSKGDPNFGTKGLIPTENTKIISQDLVGNIKFVDYNCAVVTPNAPTAGYKAPQVLGDVSKVNEGIGSGNLVVQVLNPTEIKEGAQYKIIFNSAGKVPAYKTTSYSIVRVMNGKTDSLHTGIDSSNIGKGKYSPPFDGLAVSAVNDTAIVVRHDKTGWLVGHSNAVLMVTPDNTQPARDVRWPSDYIIEWLGSPASMTPFTKINVPFKVKNLSRGDYVQAEVFDNNNNKIFDLGDDIVILEYIGTAFKLTWRISYARANGGSTNEPVAGDQFIISIAKPFISGDNFVFSTKAASLDINKAESDLNRIKVVPNPYISANSWEKRNLNQTGRGERRIDFIHLPAKCTVRIYTITGALVKTLEKESEPADGALSWDLVTEDGMDISYGLYVFHVDAPGIGSYIGKFAVVK